MDVIRIPVAVEPHLPVCRPGLQVFHEDWRCFSVIKRIHDDKGIRRSGIARAGHFDRQRVGPVCQTRCLKNHRLYLLEARVCVDVGNDEPVHVYTGDPPLRSAKTDPARQVSGECERRAIACRGGQHGGAAAPGSRRAIARPTRRVADRRIGVFKPRLPRRAVRNRHGDGGGTHRAACG